MINYVSKDLCEYSYILVSPKPGNGPVCHISIVCGDLRLIQMSFSQFILYDGPPSGDQFLSPGDYHWFIDFWL